MSGIKQLSELQEGNIYSRRRTNHSDNNTSPPPPQYLRDSVSEVNVGVNNNQLFKLL